MKTGRKEDPVITAIAARFGISRSGAAHHGQAFREQFLRMSEDAKQVLANQGKKKPVCSAPAITEEERKAQK